MKQAYFVALISLVLGACRKQHSDPAISKTSPAVSFETNMPGIYTDLFTGQITPLYKDEETGYVLDARTGEPIDLYVDVNTGDTIYGRTGTVVNNALVRNEEGTLVLDELKIRWKNDTMVVVQEMAPRKIPVQQATFTSELAKADRGRLVTGAAE